MVWTVSYAMPPRLQVLSGLAQQDVAPAASTPSPLVTALPLWAVGAADRARTHTYLWNVTLVLPALDFLALLQPALLLAQVRSGAGHSLTKCKASSGLQRGLRSGDDGCAPWPVRLLYNMSFANPWILMTTHAGLVRLLCGQPHGCSSSSRGAG